MKVLVLGLGKSGLSAAEFLLKRGHSVLGIDKRELSTTFPVICETEPFEIRGFDLLVLSPGIPLSHPICQRAIDHGVEIVGETELALRHLTNPCLGITGTNGKTTVTLLTAHVLNQCGISAKAVGNVGIPLTSFYELPKEVVFVIELSSYQLETLSTRALSAAAILNITPDHLDRYPSFDEYQRAKLNIYDCLKPDAMLYIEQSISKHHFDSDRVRTYTGVDFNDENYTASYLLCSTFGVTHEQFEKCAATFQKPPHRLELVRIAGGISYINDSKGTNIDSVIRAVEAIPQPIHLIAGGVDKGAAYQPWVKAFEGKVKSVLTIGAAAEKIEKELKEVYNVKRCRDLEHAVSEATTNARPGETVLLSPGCSSFDMFKDFEHRGNVFKSLVNSIGGENDHK
jgi:UDP-N-acetylmuramoylalanine--D-glutamate ligase